MLTAKKNLRFPSDWFGKTIPLHTSHGKFDNAPTSGTFDLMGWRWCFQVIFDVDADEYSRGVPLSVVGRTIDFDEQLDASVAYKRALVGEGEAVASQWYSFDETHFSVFVRYHRGYSIGTCAEDPQGAGVVFEEFSPSLSGNKRFQYDRSCRLWVMKAR